MEDFMYLFRGGDARELDASPEQMQDHMQKWTQWMQDLDKSGNFVAGQPLQNPGKVVKDSGKVITDGPFAEGKEIVGGYLIVKARDTDNARNHLQIALKLTDSAPEKDLLHQKLSLLD